MRASLHMTRHCERFVVKPPVPRLLTAKAAFVHGV